MTNPELAALVRRALARIRTCASHDAPAIPGHPYCGFCLLESRTRRPIRTARQILGAAE